MLKDIFKNMFCDIIGLQEISFLEKNQLNDLVTNTNEIVDFKNKSNSIRNIDSKSNNYIITLNSDKNYKHFCCESQINIKHIFPNNDNHYKIDGNAIMVSEFVENNPNKEISINEHKILHLSAERVAQMVIVNLSKSDKRIIFVNCLFTIKLVLVSLTFILQ